MDLPVAKSEGLFPRKLSISAQLVWVGVLELQVNNSIWFEYPKPFRIWGPGIPPVPSYLQEKLLFHLFRESPGVWPG